MPIVRLTRTDIDGQTIGRIDNAVAAQRGGDRGAGGRGSRHVDRLGVGRGGAGIAAVLARAGSYAPQKVGAEPGAVCSALRLHAGHSAAIRARAPEPLRACVDLASGHCSRSGSGRAGSRTEQGWLNCEAAEAGAATVMMTANFNART